jgi:hypothetical protein
MLLPCSSTSARQDDSSAVASLCTSNQQVSLVLGLHQSSSCHEWVCSLVIKDASRLPADAAEPDICQRWVILSSSCLSTAAALLNLFVYAEHPLALHVLVLQALEHFGQDIAIAFSGAEDVALIEYAHLTGRPYRVFRCESQPWACTQQQQQQQQQEQHVCAAAAVARAGAVMYCVCSTPAMCQLTLYST